MKGEDFVAWLGGDFGNEFWGNAPRPFATLEKAARGAPGRWRSLRARAAASGGVGRTRLERRVLNGSRLRGVRTAPAARSLAGVAPTGCCGSAARAAGAPSTG